MTKVYCADIDCKFNKDGICKQNKIALAWNSVVTVHDGRQDYNKCKSHEKSQRAIEIEKFYEEQIRGKL